MTGDDDRLDDDISDLILADLPAARAEPFDPCTIDRIAAAFEEIQASNLPPLPESLSVHPSEKDTFLSLFEKRDVSRQPSWMGQSLLSVPVLVDDQVHLNTVRVRVDGQDHEFPLGLSGWTTA